MPASSPAPRAASTPRRASWCWRCPTTRVDRSMGDVHPARQPALHARPRHGARSSPRNILERAWRASRRSTARPSRRTAQDVPRPPRARPWRDGRRRSSRSRAPRSSSTTTCGSIFSRASASSRSGHVEERPGIPPTPGHLTQLIAADEGTTRIKVVIVDRAVERPEAGRARRRRRRGRPASTCSRRASGAVKGADTYLDMSTTTWALAQALR